MLAFCLLVLSFIHSCSSAYFDCRSQHLLFPLSTSERSYCCSKLDQNHGPHVVKWRADLTEKFSWGCLHTDITGICPVKYQCDKEKEINYLEYALNGDSRIWKGNLKEVQTFKFLVIGEGEHSKYTDKESAKKFAAAFVDQSKLYTIVYSVGSKGGLEVSVVEDESTPKDRLCPLILRATEVGCDFITMKEGAKILKNNVTETLSKDYLYVCAFNTNNERKDCWQEQTINH